MAFDTKINLNNGKFEQISGDTLSLSGVTTVFGDIRISNTSPMSPIGESLATREFVTGQTSTASNGLTKQSNNIVLGGDLTGNTTILTSGKTLSITSTVDSIFLHVKYFSPSHGDNIGDNYYGTSSYDVVEDSEQNIWVSDTNGVNGLWRYNKFTQSSDIYSTTIGSQGSGPNLPANIVYALGTAPNLLLAPTYGGGLWVYNITGDSSQIFNSAGGANSGPDLPDNNIYGVVSDGTHIFVATETGGIWRLNINTLVADIFNSAGGANSGSNLPADDVYVLTINNGSLYAGTSAGIWRLNLGTLVGSIYNTSGGANIGPDLPEDFVFLLRSVDDYIIAGTSASGIWVYNTSTDVSQIFSTSTGSQIGPNLNDDGISNISVDPVTNKIYVEGQNFISNNGDYWVYDFDDNTSGLFRPTTDIVGLDGLTLTTQSKIHFGNDSNAWFGFGGVFLNSLYSGLTRSLVYSVSGITYSEDTNIDYNSLNSIATLDNAKNKTFKFSNGITKTSPLLKEFNEADSVKLGGVIGESTIISLTAGTLTLRNLNTANFNALTINTGSTEIGYGQIFPANNRARILFSSSGINVLLGANTTSFVVNDNRTQKKGIEYGNINNTHYSGFTTNTLAPVGYVTGLTNSSGVQTANNGLTKSGDNIRLGGVLTGNTTISGATNSLSLGTTASRLSNLNSAIVNNINIDISGTNNVLIGKSNSISGTATVDNNFVVGHLNYISGGSGNTRWNTITGEENRIINVGASSGFVIHNASLIGGFNNEIRNASNFSVYNPVILGGANNVIEPNGENISQAFIMGRNSRVEKPYGIAIGYKANATGFGSFVHSITNSATFSTDSGEQPVIASGRHAINISSNSTGQTAAHGALANYSVILGGYDHNIPSNSDRSVVIGGEAIKVSSGVTNTVHLPKVRIGQGNNATIATNNANTNILSLNPSTNEIEIRESSTLGGYDIERQFKFNSDFIAFNSDGNAEGFSVTSSAVTTSIGIPSGFNVYGVIGLLNINLNNTSGAYYSLHRSTSTGIVFGNGFECDIKSRIYTAIGGAGNDYILKFGFVRNISTTSSQDDGAYFYYRYNENGGRWIATTMRNGTATTADTGIAITNTDFVRLQIIVNEDGDEVRFYINNTLTNTLTTNIPTNAAVDAMGNGFFIQRQAGGGSLAVAIDYYEEIFTRTTDRS